MGPSTTMAYIAVFCVLVLTSAFFSFSETTITSSVDSRIFALYRRKRELSDKLLKLLERKHAFLPIILIMNNISNIFASVIATVFCVSHFGPVHGVEIAGIGTTVIIVAFSEILPKRIAIRNPEVCFRAVSPIFSPLLEFCLFFSAKVLRTTQKKRQPKPGDIDAIRSEIEFLHKSGRIAKSDTDMMTALLGLEQLNVGNIMTPKRSVTLIDLGRDPEDIIDTVIHSSNTRLPVYDKEKDNIVGILHKINFLTLLHDHANITKEHIKDTLLQAHFTLDSTKLKHQLSSFRVNKNHLSVVVNEYGNFIGVVSLEDILEEIVGNIEDEYDHKKTSSHLIKKQDGSVITVGDYQITDFNKQFGTSFAHGEFATLAGLIINMAQKIPDEGDRFMVNAWTFNILRKSSSRISLIEVTPPATGQT